MLLLTLGRGRRDCHWVVCTCIHFCWAMQQSGPSPSVSWCAKPGQGAGGTPIPGSVKARLDKKQPPAQESQNSRGKRKRGVPHLPRKS